ncbi:MAG: DeoR/GlpR family DNA-binding transcription regulator [Clostridia bacterium]
MDNKVRRRELYELIKRQKEVLVSEAAEQLGVSCMTVRRDLVEMEKEDLISRSYGKAVLKNASANELGFEERILINLAAKQSVARAAVQLVERMNSIFLDGSTTCNELAKLLPRNQKLTVITCNLNALFFLRGMPNVSVFVLGGALAPDRNNMDGEYTYLMAKNIYVDGAFMSCGGFSENGIVDSNLAGSQVRDVMMHHAGACVMLADHNKYMQRGLFNISNWDNIDDFVTDQMPQQTLIDALRKNDVRLSVTER